MPGPLALVGSGEYLPVLEDVERLLLQGRPPRFVQLATAAAPEGPSSVGRWHALGRASAERLGVQQVVQQPKAQKRAAQRLGRPGHGRGTVRFQLPHPAPVQDNEVETVEHVRRQRRMRVHDALQEAVHDVVANDDHTIALGTATATRNGKTLEYRTAEIYHIRDGKAVECWAFSDDTAAIVAFFA